MTAEVNCKVKVQIPVQMDGKLIRKNHHTKEKLNERMYTPRKRKREKGEIDDTKQPLKKSTPRKDPHLGPTNRTQTPDCRVSTPVCRVETPDCRVNTAVQPELDTAGQTV